MLRRTILFALLCLPLLGHAQRRPSEGKEAYTQLRKFNQFYGYLENLYVDTLDHRKIVEDAIVEILSELDPHSVYLSPDELKSQMESFSGSFSGIGIEFNVLRDTLMVVNTVAGGPAEQVGVLPGDRIVRIDGTDAIGIKRSDVPSRLRGPRGTRVRLGIERNGAAEPLEFTITRADIPMTTIDAAYRLEPQTGYVRVNRFAETTLDEFRQAVAGMPGIENLVLDLRGNGGGLMDQAIGMAEYFLPLGARIVSTEGLNVPSQGYSARRNGPFAQGKVVVLINETSASGSEIVAGALQDWDRALVIGRRSFGKGLVQRQIPLNDGSAIRLTIARYHTPTGRMIQRPFRMGDKEGYYTDFYERLGRTDSLAAEGESYKTLRSGRTVYGGGGIYPDLYVPADTSGYSAYWAALMRSGVLNEFTQLYLDRNRTELQTRYPDFETFNENFAVTPAMFDALSEMAGERGIAPDAAGLEHSRQWIASQIKAGIAQRLWGTTEYFRVIHAEGDAEIDRALEALHNWQRDAPGIND